MKPRIDVGGRQGRDPEFIQGNSSASKPGAHMPSEHEENRDLMNDSPLLAGLGVIVWLCVAALVFTAWKMFA